MTFSIIEHAHNDFITVTKLATVQAVKGRETQYSCTAVENFTGSSHWPPLPKISKTTRF
jgi:hypothetical protein